MYRIGPGFMHIQQSDAREESEWLRAWQEALITSISWATESCRV
jgi:hypothetical protein